MPNRVIKESIWTSPNLNNLSCTAERHFYRILLCPDDFGCFESTPKVVKGKCYPLKDEIPTGDIIQWQDELESQHIIYRWNNGAREFAIFPTLCVHQTIRSTHRRKTPEPPQEIKDKCNNLLAYACNLVQPPADAGIRSVYPNPNPNPNPNHKEGAPTSLLLDILGVLGQLSGWHIDEQDDIKWLNSFIAEFPSCVANDIKGCIDYHSGRTIPKHKGAWKNRFRNWMVKSVEFKEKSEVSGKSGRGVKKTSWGIGDPLD